MTVKELIEKLEQMPSDADVFVPSQTGGWCFVSDVIIEEDNDSVVRVS